MQGFNFEKNLNHQTQAVNSTVAVFEHVHLNASTGVDSNFINPSFDLQEGSIYPQNILKTQKLNGLDEKVNRNSNIIDIMMETGTGKTYTYTKTLFELNKYYGIFKFVIVVPTLSIKAGTIDFLKSESAREHFREQYGKTIKLHVVESKKGIKSKKSFIPPAVNSFVNAGSFDKNNIQVMLINAGMINSDTMQKSFDKGMFDKYTIPYKGIAAINPYVIVDEPHKFGQSNKTWKNLLQMNPQCILRYGATFTENENLVYRLSAVDAFNRNLVKGVIGHVTEYENSNALVKLNGTNGTEATFELTESGKKKTFKLAKKESLQKVHEQMTDLSIENLNKTTVVLSNGLEMKRGDKINPFSFAQTVQETMIRKTVAEHFKLEKELLTRDVKIKPLTLFFIDNIEEYRNENGYLKTTLENLVKGELKNLLKTEKDVFYKEYLEIALADVSKTHGGYFSKDNSDKDEAIEQEVNEILHDKQAMLELDNPRRFIFSKWTLREGWDNPNVFQICKLRSSGSEISKLQEVGRGLRLPVNEYGNRVKDEQFFLNYFVDFTENDFVERLVDEINENSGVVSIEAKPDKLTDDIINKISEVYEISEDNLLEVLDNNNVITRTNTFKEGGFNFIKTTYPLIFQGVSSNKVRKSTNKPEKVTIRAEKYKELKELWEKLNEKVILEYKFKNEREFQALLKDFFKGLKDNFSEEGIKQRKQRINIENDEAILVNEISVFDNVVTQVSTMKYSDFLKDLAKELNINLKSLHLALVGSGVEINKYLNPSSIRIIKNSFKEYLLANAVDKFTIEYKRVSNAVHPTKFTDRRGKVLKEMNATDIGVKFNNKEVAKSYFINELYYDSDLEEENIKTEIKEVVVFTKIPKNSISIPVAGGGTYSPDFAYVVDYKNGEKTLHFVVETKNVKGDNELRPDELRKIKHAEIFFNGKVKIEFKKQFSGEKITALIKDIIKE